MRGGLHVPEIVGGECVDVGQDAVELLFLVGSLLGRERETGELGDFLDVYIGGGHGGR